MTDQQIHERLLERFGDQVVLDLHTGGVDSWIEVADHAVADVCLFLRDDEDLKFETINDLSAVDYLQPDEKKAKKFPFEPHLEVVYHLYSYTHKHWCKIKIKLPRWKDDQPDALPEVPSVARVWGIADWHEREAYDLMGIHFTGHPNLVRILCPEDWVGHPLRKDYEQPLEYHGIRGR